MDCDNCLITENYVVPVVSSEIILIKQNDTLDNIGLYFPDCYSCEEE